MKPIILLFLVAVVASNCFAQLNEDKLFYLKKSEKYRRMRNTGATLAVGGTILAIIGISTLTNSPSIQNSNGTQTYTGDNAVTGAVTYIAGLACVGAGVPLWIVGGHAHRKYEKKLESVTVRLNATPQQTGLTLRYRF
jgi:hypothetical protein